MGGPQERTKLKFSQISFTITNNTDSVIVMNFLANLSNTADISNQHGEYAWDLSGYFFEYYTTGAITFRTVGSTAPYTTLDFIIQQPSLQGLLAALNGLMISSFFVDTTGGNTILKTYNDAIEFTALTINSTGPVQSNVYFQVNNSGVGTTFDILRNGGVLYTGNFPQNDPAPVLVVPYVNGDTFQLTGVAPTGVNTTVTVNQFEYSTGITTQLFTANYNPGDSMDTGALPFVDPDFRYDILVTEF